MVCLRFSNIIERFLLINYLNISCDILPNFAAKAAYGYQKAAFICDVSEKQEYEGLFILRWHLVYSWNVAP